jgi:hypothetical protein
MDIRLILKYLVLDFALETWPKCPNMDDNVRMGTGLTAGN